MTITDTKTRQTIIALLDDLSADKLKTIETFIRFIRHQAENGSPAAEQTDTPWLYPTVPVPAESLGNWMNLLDEGYEGDALADTEALYDEV